jgi:hypothetical protein
MPTVPRPTLTSVGSACALQCACRIVSHIVRIIQGLPIDLSVHEVFNRVFTRPSCKVLRVTDVAGPPDEHGRQTLLASVMVRFPHPKWC